MPPGPLLRRALLLAGLLLTAGPAQAQPYETVGLRALGMGGAFVAVADDATAGYWNPAGLATGRFFSIVLDTNRAGADVDALGQGTTAGTRLRGSIVAIGTPPLGVSYYRLTSIAVREGPDGRVDDGDTVDLRALRTSHVGVTLVQTLIDRLHAGATFKYVRGEAASALTTEVQGDLLDAAAGLPARGTGAFDVDVGLMADLGRVRAGLAARNLLAPAFAAPVGETLRLRRQLRAGAAIFPTSTLSLAVDTDLTASEDLTGRWRSLAIGAEQRLLQERVGLRGGLRVSTLGAARTALTAGASVALRAGVFADGYAAIGVGRQAASGGGAGLRVVF
jgi:hypothetical protein